MSANLHTSYAERKHGRQAIDFPHPDLTEILEPTYGILVYQEQVLEIAKSIAGFSLGEADMLRRAIGKKKQKEMDAQKSKFLDGCVSKGYEASLGKSLWDLIEGFADYAFNKSHSAGYGLVSYQTAWLKANYPVEYMAALLTSVKNNKDRLPLYLHTCRTMGLTVLPPDVNTSELDFAPAPLGADAEANTAIRFGMSAVRQVGEAVVEAILDARRKHGAFADFADFCEKVDSSCLNKRTLEALIKAGAFESLGHPRKGLLFAFEGIVEQALARKRAEAEGQFSLFDSGGADTPAELIETVAIPAIEFDRSEKLAAEREMLGLYVSDHPLLGLERVLKEVSDGTIPELLAGSAGIINAAGILTGKAKKFTKKGEPYVTGTLEDLEGGIEVMFFPAVFQSAADLLVDDAILCVRGRLDNGDPPKMIAMDVSAPDLSDATGAPVTLTLAPQQCTPTVVGRLKAVLAEHPGVVPVHLALRNGTKRTTRLRLGDGMCVTRTPGLYAELKSILGADAVS
jgi:DNA polymerase-3 subunit alpha